MSQVVGVALLWMGVVCWAGWLVWGCILLLPWLRHPRVPEWPGLSAGHWAVMAAAACLFVLTFSPWPFHGQSGIALLHDWWTGR